MRPPPSLPPVAVRSRQALAISGHVMPPLQAMLNSSKAVVPAAGVLRHSRKLQISWSVELSDFRQQDIMHRSPVEQGVMLLVKR